MLSFKISQGGESLEVPLPVEAESLQGMTEVWGDEILYELARRGLEETMRRAARTLWKTNPVEVVLARMADWTPLHLVPESEAAALVKAYSALSEAEKAKFLRIAKESGL